MKRRRSRMTAAKLAAWRRRHGLSLVVGAEWLGVSRSALQGYLSGAYPVPPTVALLSRAIDMLTSEQREDYDRLSMKP